MQTYLSLKMPLPELCKNFACDSCTLVKREQALSGSFRSVVFKPNRQCITVEQILDQCRPGIKAAFEEIIRKRLKAKAQVNMQVLFHKINFMTGEVDKEDRNYMSVALVKVESEEQVAWLIQNARSDLEAKVDDYTNKGSNWIVAAIELLGLNVVSYK